MTRSPHPLYVPGFRLLGATSHRLRYFARSKSMAL